MKVLLTGATGFLGKYLQIYLEEHTDWDIVTSGCDLTVSVPLGYKVDYVINLASISSVEYSIKNPEETIEENIMMMTTLMEYARNFKPKLFLHFSSVEVSEINNPYAASKAAQEAIAEAYAKTFKIPTTIARSTNIIGPGQSPEKFVPKIVDSIFNDRIIEVYDGGRIYNTIENVCSAILFMLKLGSPPAEPLALYEIDGGEGLLNEEMVNRIAARIGKKAKMQKVSPKAKRPAYTQYLSYRGHLLSRQGWKPPETLDEGLAWIA